MLFCFLVAWDHFSWSPPIKSLPFSFSFTFFSKIWPVYFFLHDLRIYLALCMFVFHVASHFINRFHCPKMVLVSILTSTLVTLLHGFMVCHSSSTYVGIQVPLTCLVFLLTKNSHQNYNPNLSIGEAVNLIAQSKGARISVRRWGFFMFYSMPISIVTSYLQSQSIGCL